jgi:hypothetical protein
MRLRLLPIVLLVAAAVAGGCETSSTVTEGPSPVRCQVALTTPAMLEAGGGNSALTVTTQPECAWNASTNANWITGLSPASGQGTGDLQFRVAANDGTAAREGTITVNTGQVRVSQRAPCRYEVAPATQNMSAAGGPATASVTTASDCAWSATADVNWITLAPPVSGNGNATVSFTVAPNAGGERTGNVIIGGQRSTIRQAAVAAAPNCSFTIAPTSLSIGATGGPGTVNVSTQAGCRWTAGSNVPWITITSGASGTDDGAVTFTVAANTGGARNGTLTVAGQTFTVTQAGAGAPPPPPPSCTYSISPTSQTVAAGGGTGNVAVTTQAACAWTATSNATWITITAGAAGTGNGSVTFNAAANTGAARTGTLTIGGQTFTVTQPAAPPPPPACTYTIAPTSQAVDAAGGTGTVNVTTQATCAWTAVSNATWITVTSGATGTGNGAVAFSVAANTGAARTGTLTIGGQTFTVTQSAAPPPPPPPPTCTYSISPAGQTVPALGGTGTVAVTTQATCAWTAVSNATWITVTSGAAGTGNGTVAFSVAVNTGAARTGTLTIAGQTFTVTQSAVAPVR